MTAVRAATKWTVLELLVRQGGQFFFLAWLAHLLTPSDFGQIAVLTGFAAVAGVISEFGLATAIIHSPTCTVRQLSTAFWLNLIVGVVIATSVVVFRDGYSGVLNMPSLSNYAPHFATVIVLTAATSMPLALLRKALNFHPIFIAGLVSTIAAGTVGIVLAYRLRSPLALAWSTLVGTGVNASLIWRGARWWPTLQFSPESIKDLTRYGTRVFLASMLDVSYSRIYVYFIGRHFGAADLGIYNRADQVQSSLITALTGVISRVAFPNFSKLNAESGKENLQASFRTSLWAAMAITVPIMAGLILVAPEFVIAIFGRQWIDAVAPLRILAVGALVWPVHVINMNMLLALGGASKFLALEVVKKIIGITILVLGFRGGVEGVAVSYCAFSFICLPINTYFTKKMLAEGLLKQVFGLSGLVIPALTMSGVVMWILGSLADSTVFVRLASSIVMGGISYVGLLWLLNPTKVKALVRPT